ncbi:putative monocarboxylate transporter [Schizothecium vesticola]|uniref:Monocarboxylate transporter n=1 Tax=Schizothecium vesticola TaxID=314040 RepID=A0AA40F0V7_9PEZI|nr:putative monocarboxylate transporter [Schizothecium vesticola]
MAPPALAPPVVANSAKLDDTDPDEIRRHLDDSDDTYHSSTYTAFHDKEGGEDGLDVNSASAPPPAHGAPGPPPNGGLNAWLQVASGFCVFFNSWGVLNTFGVFQTYYETGELFVASSSDISWIGSIQAYCVLVFGLLSGPIYDRGYLRSLMAIGSFLIVFGFMMLSISTQYWHAVLAQGFCVGIGAGLLFIPAVAVLPQYFTTRMALAMGIAASGSSLGGVVYPVAFLNLLNKIGFAWSVRVIGFIALATLITPVIFMEMRVKPIKPRAVLDWTVFTDWPFAFFTLSTMFGFAGLYVMLFYISFYTFATGIASRHMAFYLVPILNAGSMFGRTLPNALADKIGPLNVLAPGAICCGILTFAMLGVKTLPAIIVITLIYGFFSGIFIALPPVCFVRLTADKSKVGTRMGMGFTIFGFGVLAGGPGGGGILGERGGDLHWTNLFVYAGVLATASGVFMTVLRFWLTKGKLWVKI